MPIFLRFTALDGTAHLINFYWVETLSPGSDESGLPITMILLVGEDEPIIVKASASDILQMLDEEMAKQKERIDNIRAKLIDKRE